MNLRLVSRLLGVICLLIGGFMLFSMPWAHPALGVRNASHIVTTGEFETRGFMALFYSCILCGLVGAGLMWWGRRAAGTLYRKEAMAVVGLAWVLATLLGALPFYFGHVAIGPSIRLTNDVTRPLLFRGGLRPWVASPTLTAEQTDFVAFLLAAGAEGQTDDVWQTWRAAQGQTARGPTQIVAELVQSAPLWQETIESVVDRDVPENATRFRIAQREMSLGDAMFESQSGFSTTGATVISHLEDPRLVPHCLLFWRSSTHFLGGLGIIVLFVAILGHGSAGKAMMRAELPGPTQDSSQTRIQHAAWSFAAAYVALNVVLILIMRMFDMTWFDATCHAFGTMATGGFSTYDASLGHFHSTPLELIVALFMVLAGSNFTLLILSLRGRPLELLRDVEWQTYITIIVIATILIVLFGMAHGDFSRSTSAKLPTTTLQIMGVALRDGLFQVVSIMTTTGYGTCDFDAWNDFSRAVIFVLMFVGGCAGSTGGGIKVVRSVLAAKILRLEIEQSFRPNVVRPLRLAGKPVGDPRLQKNILVYFLLILTIFVMSTLLVVMVEPSTSWPDAPDSKLVDCASIVAANLNNIGPGLGTVGPTCNYGHLSPLVKILCTWLMMLGRVEVYVILCLFTPRFWRNG